MLEIQSTTCATDRDTLIRRYLPLVRRVARTHRGRLPAGVDFDDLVSWGTFGLLAAIERFDASRGALFSTYARFRIRGAILDQLRQHESAPRSVREKIEAVARVAREVEARHGRPASEDELACGLGLTVPAYRELLGRTAPLAMLSLDDARLETAGPEAWFAGSGAEPLGALLRRERSRLLADAIRRLPERQQLVLSLYYRDDLTMKEVGTALGVTESRVSQLHRQALVCLRAQLSPCMRDAPLKVRRGTADRTAGVAWEPAGNETPCAMRTGGRDASRESGNACEPDAMCSTPMRPRGRSSKRCAAIDPPATDPARAAPRSRRPRAHPRARGVR